MIETKVIVECDWDACRERVEATLKRRKNNHWVELPVGWGQSGIIGSSFHSILCPRHVDEQHQIVVPGRERSS